MGHPERLSSLILRPSALLTLAWGTLAMAWLMLVLVGTPLTTPRADWPGIAVEVFALGTAVQVLLAAGLLLELRWARRAPVGLRRAQVAGLAVLAIVQVLGTLAWLGLGA